MSKIWKVKDGGDTDQGTDININELTSKLENHQCKYLSENPVKFNSDSPSSQYQHVVVQITNEDTLNNKFNKSGFYIIKDLHPSDSLFLFQFSIDTMLEITKTEFNDADVEITQQNSNEPKKIRVSWKSQDSKKGNTKRHQPVIISLNEDFSTSVFFKNPISVVGESFLKFIRNKRIEFKPRATNSTNETHIPEYWIFPPEC